MNKYLVGVSIIATVLAIIIRYILGAETSGDVLMWLFSLAIISLAVGVWKS